MTQIVVNIELGVMGVTGPKSVGLWHRELAVVAIKTSMHRFSYRTTPSRSLSLLPLASRPLQDRAHRNDKEQKQA